MSKGGQPATGDEKKTRGTVQPFTDATGGERSRPAVGGVVPQRGARGGPRT